MAPEAQNLSALKRAFLAIETLEAKLAHAEAAHREPIAIVGMGCRFPGEEGGPDGFWKVLAEGRDVVDEVPEERWRNDDYYDPDPAATGRMYTRHGHFLRAADQFDAELFGVSRREACAMDPQQRLLLEVAWQALEHAGHPADSLRETRTGVYVGLMTTDYARMQMADSDPELRDAYTGTGNGLSFPAGRLSYVLGLQGPSMVVATECSSSLVSVHVASQALRAGECDVALAGGVALMLDPETSVLLSRMRALSPDGRCKAFDAAADGYGRGEGCGIVVLKRLSDARAAGDRILAVLPGSAVNHDGPSGGLTVPSGPAQRKLITEALAAAGIEPGQVSYVEAHGTGTALGDPIEVDALAQVYGRAREAERPLWIGSVKTNIGHLEAAAGIAGLIKVVLALQHESIPAHVHFSQPSAHIPWQRIAVRVAARSLPWPRGEQPRVAAVSSFGLSGSNAHVLVQEAPAPAALADEPGSDVPRLLPVSANTPAALALSARALADHLRARPETSLDDLCTTAARFRTHYTHRAALAADDLTSLLAELDQLADTAASEARPVPVGHKVAFLFAGQGSQFPGMGRELYEREPVFREQLERCAALLEGELQVPLLEVMYGTRSALLSETAYTQPALFALEYALCALWSSWGIRPDAVAGHSLGEYVAACVAGVLSLEDALRLCAARGRLMQALPESGAMVSFEASEATVREWLAGSEHQVSIAAVNTPTETVVSGDARQLELLRACAQQVGVIGKRLDVSHAFHSPLMEPMCDDFVRVVEQLALHRPRLALYSNLTGARVHDEVTEPGYYRAHVRSCVRFADTIRALSADGYTTFVEVGPSATLTRMAQQNLPAQGAVFVASLRRQRADRQMLRAALAQLYASGVDPDWSALLRGQRSELPNYPFTRSRYWFKKSARKALSRAHAVLGGRVHSPLLRGALFEAEVSSDRLGWVQDHRVYGTCLVPGAYFLLLALHAAHEIGRRGGVQIEDFELLAPLVLDAESERKLQIYLTSGDASSQFEIASFASDDATSARVHARGQLSALRAVTEPATALTFDAALDAEAFYRQLDALELSIGPSLRYLQGSIEIAKGLARATLAQPSQQRAEAGQRAGFFDAAFHLLAAAVGERMQGLGVPVRVARIALPSLERVLEVSSLRAEASVRRIEGQSVDGDVSLRDADGALVVALEGIEARGVDRRVLLGEAAPRDAGLYQLRFTSVATTSATTPLRGRWLVLVACADLGAELIRRMTAAGAQVTAVADEAALAEALQGQTRYEGALNLWSLDLPRLALDSALADVTAISAAAAARTLAALQTLLPAGKARVARLLHVTRGAQLACESDASVLSIAQAGSWGSMRVAMAEHPDLCVTLVDLDPRDPREDCAQLLAELATNDTELQVAYRAGVRLGARLERASSVDAAREAPQRLGMSGRGSLDLLRSEPIALTAPAAGEVQLRVHATGLNFRDVLNVLDMYPGDPGPLGLECAGSVVALGEGVSTLQVGDEVLSLAPGSLGTHVNAPALLTVRRPAALTAAEGASVPVAFLTAYEVLVKIANVQPGERVLIHAAAGGFGMAAVQIAQALGAEVFATASPGKWPLLEAMGVRHIANSRTLEFASQFRAATEGAGVHVVLNSLTGAFLAESMRLLVDEGRFIEIGKAEILTAAQACALHRTAAYHAFDLVQMAHEDPETVHARLVEVMAKFAEGSYRPLPRRDFAFEEASAAFRTMARARHVGKLVICQPGARAGASERALPVNGQGTYLITGGLGALGRRVAAFLIDHGARSIVLTGRSEPNDEARAFVASLQARGADVRTWRADVSSERDVNELFTQLCERGLPPVRGVVHAAGVLDDALIANQNEQRFARVLAPKLHGAWNLHRATAELELDFFVMFSSVAASIGSRGQANYAMANAFIDALATLRRGLGLVGQTINWGPFCEGGMAADLSERERAQWSGLGVTLLTAERGMELLASLLAQRTLQTSAILVDWRRYLSSFGGAAPVLYERFAQPATSQPLASTIASELACAPAEARESMIASFLQREAGRILGMQGAEKLGLRTPFSEAGVDSLMGVEMKAAVERHLAVQLPSSLLYDFPTVAALAAQLHETLFAQHEDTRSITTSERLHGEPTRVAAEQTLQGMSDAELAALISAQASVLGLTG